MLLLIIPATGCATILKGNLDEVTIATAPPGAYAWVDGDFRGQTPMRIELDSRREHTVDLRLDGYADAHVLLQRTVGAGWLLLDVVAGLVPLLVDAITGAWHYLDDVRLQLVPGTSSLPPPMTLPRSEDPAALPGTPAVP